MVRISNIREKFRSDALKDLARERQGKRSRPDTSSSQAPKVDDEEDITPEPRVKKVRESKSSLLSLLPEPKNASSFGPSVKLDKLLKMPKRADNVQLQAQNQTPEKEASADEMLEVDVSKHLTNPIASSVKDLTIEMSAPVILPKGKEKQKNQITYLAQLSKATELKQKEQAAQGRANRAAARSKYGW